MIDVIVVFLPSESLSDMFALCGGLDRLSFGAMSCFFEKERKLKMNSEELKIMKEINKNLEKIAEGVNYFTTIITLVVLLYVGGSVYLAWCSRGI